jgi:hypothetical protein
MLSFELDKRIHAHIVIGSTMAFLLVLAVLRVRISSSMNG